MVAAAFPIIKLTVLFMKHVSKPIANACKERAKNSLFFRTYICMPPAFFYNWCEVKTKMWILNLGRPVNIPVMSQEMAIELGANLIGETFIFIVAAGLLTIEYNRQSKNETTKEEKRIAELNHINDTMTYLYFTVQQQQTRLEEMERLLHSDSGKKSTTSAPEIKKPKLPPTVSGLESPAPLTVSNTRHSNMMRHNGPTAPTPFPENGLILKSLNYIQMDVFRSVFPHRNSENDNQQPEEKLKAIHQERENAVPTLKHYNIENNFRSLF